MNKLWCVVGKVINLRQVIAGLDTKKQQLDALWTRI